MSKARTGMIAALDIGTTKVCCFIAEHTDDARLQITGVGHQACRGLRSGAIVDMETVRTAILAAVHGAEQMAGETIHGVFVNVSGGRPSSNAFAVEVPITGHEVDQGDVRRVLEQGRQRVGSDDREILHSIPVGFRIDGSRGIRDPRGMYGERLGVEVHVITAAAGPVRNVATCISACHLDVDAFVVTPYASGLACLVDDELSLGVTVIDMGGGTTSIAVFDDGELVHADSVPIGGQHVTTDIAHGLSTPLADAERIKTVYGSAIAMSADEREVIDVPQVGEDEHTQPNHVPKSLLVGVIQPRVEEIFEMVRARLETSGLFSGASRRVVLTGGASKLTGVRELATLVLDRQVRVGRPLAFRGLAEATSGPAFSTCAGLLEYAVQKHAGGPSRIAGNFGEPRGLIGRIGQWLHENI